MDVAIIPAWTTAAVKMLKGVSSTIKEAGRRGKKVVKALSKGAEESADLEDATTAEVDGGGPDASYGRGGYMVDHCCCYGGLVGVLRRGRGDGRRKGRVERIARSHLVGTNTPLPGDDGRSGPHGEFSQLGSSSTFFRAGAPPSRELLTGEQRPIPVLSARRDSTTSSLAPDNEKVGRRRSSRRTWAGTGRTSGRRSRWRWRTCSGWRRRRCRR